MPLPNTRVIGDNWSRHHRPTANGQLALADGTIVRPPSGADAVFDEEAGRSVLPAAATIYDGPFRVQRLAQAVSDSTTTTADRELTIREYQVTVDIERATTAIQINDVVELYRCPDDPHLVGHPLRVRDVRLGTLAWQRDLLCEDIAPTTR